MSASRIDWNIHSDIKQILADPTQIHQVVMNLCTNAFHAMEPTGGTLTLSLENAELSIVELQQHPEVTPGSFVILTIGDTGPGIPSEIRERIFDPYFTTKGVGKSTGMGLAIIHGLVKNYGGFITVESEPGQGTRFHVHLPAVEHQDIPENVEDKAITGGNEHILLVDDEEIVADMSRSVLEHLGYPIHLVVQDAMGHRTSEVYGFAAKWPGRVQPYKGGSGRRSTPHSFSTVDTYPGTNKPCGVRLVTCDTHCYKDDLASKLHPPGEDPGAYHMYDEISMEYAQEYRDERGLWQYPNNVPNHYWDCENMAGIAADILQIKYWPLPTAA